MHLQPDVAATSDKKPKVMLYYNSAKGGVDTLDRMVRTYTCKRVTRRWPVSLLYNMIDISAVNDFILWLELNGENPNISVRKGQKFPSKAAKRACCTQPDPSLRFLIATGSAPKRKNDANDHKAPKLKRQQCSLCDRNKDRKTRFVCFSCKNYVYDFLIVDLFIVVAAVYS